MYHEFSKINAKSSSTDVTAIVDYLQKICNPLSERADGEPMRNIVDGYKDRRSFEFVMTCQDKVYDIYQKYLDSRLIKKDVGLFEPIKRNQQIQRSKDDNIEKVNANKETIHVMKYIEYATFRGYAITEVLKCEITNLPFYLINIDDGSLKNSSKSLLSRKLLEQLSVKPSLSVLLSILWRIQGKFP